jgi:hypothetical protein
MIDEKLTQLRESLPNVTGAEPPQDEEEIDDTVFADGQEEEVLVEDATGNGNTPPTRITYRQYSYDGRFWHVPKAFKFPTGMHLDTAWKIWIYGLPVNETIDANGTRCQAPIRPFRSIKPEMLPKAVKQDFQLHWRPIFSMMEQAPGLNIREAGVVDATYVTASFDSAKTYLKTRVSYVFEKERSNPDMWEISTWSRKVQRSSILKDGTNADRANLPGDTSHRTSGKPNIYWCHKYLQILQ